MCQATSLKTADSCRNVHAKVASEVSQVRACARTRKGAVLFQTLKAQETLKIWGAILSEANPRLCKPVGTTGSL